MWTQDTFFFFLRLLDPNLWYLQVYFLFQAEASSYNKFLCHGQ